MATLRTLSRAFSVRSHQGTSRQAFFSSSPSFSDIPAGNHPIVVGNTVGGLSFAIQYHRATGKVLEIVNASSSPSYSDNQCVVLPVSAMRIFREFGIESQLLASGCPIQKIVNRNGASNEKTYSILSLDAYDTPTIGISAQKLMQVLQERAEKIGIPIRTKKAISSITSTESGATCFFKGGKYSKAQHSAVVISDGDSNLLEYFGPRPKGPDLTPNKFRVEEYKFIARIPKEHHNRDSHTKIWGNGIFMEWFPINQHYYSVSTVCNSKYAGIFRSGHSVSLRDYMSKVGVFLHGEGAKAILAQATEATKIETHYPKNEEPKQWFKDAVIRIGSSCYGILPGSHHHPIALEVEDGYLLAKKISGGTTLAALDEFGKARAERIAPIAKYADTRISSAMKVREGSYAVVELTKLIKFGGYFEKRHLDATIKKGV